MNLPQDLKNIIGEYAGEYKLLTWVDEKKLSRNYLSNNPNAIHILESFIKDSQNNLDKVDWRGLSHNPNAIHVVESFIKDSQNNLDKVDWKWLSQNPSIFKLTPVKF